MIFSLGLLKMIVFWFINNKPFRQAQLPDGYVDRVGSRLDFTPERYTKNMVYPSINIQARLCSVNIK